MSVELRALQNPQDAFILSSIMHFPPPGGPIWQDEDLRLVQKHAVSEIPVIRIHYGLPEMLNNKRAKLRCSFSRTHARTHTQSEGMIITQPHMHKDSLPHRVCCCRAAWYHEVSRWENITTKLQHPQQLILKPVIYILLLANVCL